VSMTPLFLFSHKDCLEGFPVCARKRFRGKGVRTGEKGLAFFPLFPFSARDISCQPLAKYDSPTKGQGRHGATSGLLPLLLFLSLGHGLLFWARKPWRLMDRGSGPSSSTLFFFFFSHTEGHLLDSENNLWEY